MLKCFAFNRKKLLYDPVWAFLATSVYAEFNGHHDSYVMLAFIVKSLYPKVRFLSQKYFNVDSNFAAKNTEIELFTKYAKIWVPDLYLALTFRKGYTDRNSGTNEMFESNFAFTIHMKRISDLILTKLFALQIDLHCYIKLLDILFLFGFDFLHKLGIFMIDFLKKDTIHKVKKFVKSANRTEDSFSIAAILATERIMKEITKPVFLNILKKVLTKNELDLFVAENRETFLIEAKSNVTATNERIIVERVQRIIHTKYEFTNANVPLNIENIKQYIKDFDDETQGLVAVPYIPFRKYLSSKKGKFKWNDRVINSFYLTMDTKFRGAIQPVEFKVVLTLLSTLSKKEKLKMISSFISEGRSGIVDPTDAVILLEKIEEIVCSDLKTTSTNTLKVSTKIRERFSKDNSTQDIPVCKLMDFAKEVTELSALFSVLNGIEEDKDGIKYNPKLEKDQLDDEDAVLDSSPNGFLANLVSFSQLKSPSIKNDQPDYLEPLDFPANFSFVSHSVEEVRNCNKTCLIY